MLGVYHRYRNDLTIYEYDHLFVKMRENHFQRLNMYHTGIHDSIIKVSGSIYLRSSDRKYKTTTFVYEIGNISYQAEQAIY